MAFRTRCTECGATIDVPSSVYQGKSINCTSCRKTFLAESLSLRSFVFRCISCKGQISATWEDAGRLVACPRCASSITLPDPFTLEKNSSNDQVPELKKCPHCSEKVLYDAIKCKHCGSSLIQKSPEDQHIAASEQARLSRLPEGKFDCPQCKSRKTQCERAVGFAVLIIIFISCGIGLIMIPFLPYSCRCNACGFKWKT